MGYAPMKAEVIRDQGNRDYVEVWVEHHERQSYSRAVQPRAMKEARRCLRDGRQWELFDVDYDSERDATAPDRCWSVYMFRVSKPQGRQA